MLIQCHHCGAPLDVKSARGTTKCRYCGTTTRVEQTTTPAAQTPTGWNAPRQWVPPEGFSANPGQALRYRRSPIRTLVTIMIAVAVVGFIGSVVMAIVFPAVAIFAAMRSTQEVVDNTATDRAVNAAVGRLTAALGSANPPGAVDDTDKDLTAAMAQVTAAMAQATQQMTAAAQADGAGQPNLLTSEGAALAIASYRQKLGGGRLRATQLVLHPDFALLRGQDPKIPNHVNDYEYRGAAVGEPQAARLDASEKANLEARLFDLDDVPLSRLSALDAQALAKLGYEGAEVTHVIVERERRHPVVRIYVRGPRESGFVEFDTSGKIVRASE